MNKRLFEALIIISVAIVAFFAMRVATPSTMVDALGDGPSNKGFNVVVDAPRTVGVSRLFVSGIQYTNNACHTYYGGAVYGGADNTHAVGCGFSVVATVGVTPTPKVDEPTPTDVVSTPTVVTTPTISTTVTATPTQPPTVTPTAPTVVVTEVTPTVNPTQPPVTETAVVTEEPTARPTDVATSTPKPEHANCGVGNGVDPDTNGCEEGRNDGEGTGPGAPGSAGGNGNGHQNVFVPFSLVISSLRFVFGKREKRSFGWTNFGWVMDSSVIPFVLWVWVVLTYPFSARKGK